MDDAFSCFLFQSGRRESGGVMSFLFGSKKQKDNTEMSSSPASAQDPRGGRVASSSSDPLSHESSQPVKEFTAKAQSDLRGELSALREEVKTLRNRLQSSEDIKAREVTLQLTKLFVWVF